MQARIEPSKCGRWRWLGHLVGMAAASVTLCGCAGFWDEVTSNDFKFAHLYGPKPNPLVVLKDSNDGDKRAEALRSLKEPNANGGTPQDQEVIVKILVTAANSEKQFLCRLAAIQTLGTFKDPRAVGGLTDAFYNSGSFSPDIATRLQCDAVLALGKTGNPAAVPFLAKVAKGLPGDGTEHEKQQLLDVRMAAAHALGQFPIKVGEEALVGIMKSEKDVALRDCARNSLETCMNQKIPADYTNWDTLLSAPPAKNASWVDQFEMPKILRTGFDPLDLLF